MEYRNVWSGYSRRPILDKAFANRLKDTAVQLTDVHHTLRPSKQPTHRRLVTPLLFSPSPISNPAVIVSAIHKIYRSPPQPAGQRNGTRSSRLVLNPRITATSFALSKQPTHRRLVTPL